LFFKELKIPEKTEKKTGKKIFFYIYHLFIHQLTCCNSQIECTKKHTFIALLKESPSHQQV